MSRMSRWQLKPTRMRKRPSLTSLVVSTAALAVSSHLLTTTVRATDEDEDDEDEEAGGSTLPSGPKEGRNSQLSVGYKGDRSYVVRGDKIGVFRHKPDEV